MSYFVHLPPELVDALRPNERIACTNASIIVDENDQLCGWIDNDSMIAVYVDTERSNND